MLGSAASVSDVNTVINTAVAETLKGFADRLESAESFEDALHEIIRDTVREHKRILFNGNGYDQSWVDEAEKRGLSNLKTTPEALKHFLDEKNVTLFSENKIFSETELRSRKEIMLENYCKLINIESLTMIEMARKEIIPAVISYVKDLSKTVINVKSAVPTALTDAEEEIITSLSSLVSKANTAVKELDVLTAKANAISDNEECADFYLGSVIPKMKELRKICDEAETLTAESYWPFPTYGDILFSVR